MLPEIGATELLVIAAVALIVVGPKDLPLLLRKLGQFMGKLRAMASDFRASFDEMARQTELDELRAEVEAMRKGQVAEMAALKAGDAEMTQVFHDIHDGLTSDAGARLPADPDGMAPLAEPAPSPKPKAKKAATGKSKAPAKPKAAQTKAVAPKTVAPKTAPKPRARKSGTVT